MNLRWQVSRTPDGLQVRMYPTPFTRLAVCTTRESAEAARRLLSGECEIVDRLRADLATARRPPDSPPEEAARVAEIRGRESKATKGAWNKYELGVQLTEARATISRLETQLVDAGELAAMRGQQTVELEVERLRAENETLKAGEHSECQRANRLAGQVQTLEEAVRILEALLASLPKCDNGAHESRPATRAWGRGGERYCDECGRAQRLPVPDYPRADAVRKAVAFLAERNGSPKAPDGVTTFRDGSRLVYCTYCNKTHSVMPGEKPCGHYDSWLDPEAKIR